LSGQLEKEEERVRGLLASGRHLALFFLRHSVLAVLSCHGVEKEKAMSYPSPAATWQDLLAELLKNSAEKARLAEELSVQPITLVRWAAGISHPRENNMQSLAQAMPPSLFHEFYHLAAQEYPQLHQVDTAPKAVPASLPSTFYAQSLRAYSQLPALLCRQTLQDLLFQQVIAHLDPERRGMSISLVVCVRPFEGQVVRSLREIGGIGTPPWKRDLEQKTMLLGAESLAGYALMNFKRTVVSNRIEQTRVPVHWTTYEQSAAAVPIARHSRVCGCLLAASVVPDMFQEEQPLVQALEEYAQMATLLFEPGDFYDLQTIQLRYMPPDEMQRPYFRQIHQRVLQRFRLAQVRGEACTLELARQQVWREIEEELIQVFLQTPTCSSSRRTP
jgi:hypothetical protein